MEPVRAAHRPDRRTAHRRRRGGRLGAGAGGPQPASGRGVHQSVRAGPAAPPSSSGLTAALEDPDLQEWDYGGYEGLTTDQIRQTRPGWFLWRDGVPAGDAAHPGETAGQVGARADAVLRRAGPLLAGGDVALVAHGHLLRVLTARWLGLEPEAGRYFRLDTGTLSTLGIEHGLPVITSWNVPHASFE